MLLITLLIEALIISSTGIEISGISTDPSTPNQGYLTGSVAGGTTLYIQGVFDPGDPSSSQIYIDNQNCTIIEYYSSSSYLQCITPPSKHPNGAKAQITAFYYGTEILVNYGVKMEFTYTKWSTPVVFYINPAEAAPGDEVSFVGRWMTTSWSQFENAKTDTQNMIMYLLDSSQTFGSWDIMNLTAVLGDNDQGDKNSVIKLNGPYGYAFNLWSGNQIDMQGNSYNFRTLARIDKISEIAGSVAGGQELTIEGEGFPLGNAKIRVEIDGNDFDVKSVEYTKIKCVTSAAMNSASSEFYEGSAGLIREVWSGQTILSLNFDDLEGITPNFTFNIATAQIPRDEDVNIRDRMYGLFKAPVTGNYSFFVSSDDYCEIFLGTSDNSTTKKSILKYQSYTSLRDQFSRSIPSANIELEKDQNYYIEIRHIQGSGASHLDVGVKISDSDLPNTMPYVQNLQILPGNVTYEVQTITIFGTNSGPTGGKLRLIYGTTVRDPINWNANAGMWTCADILNQTSYLGLGSLSCDGVWVDNNTLAYNITFNSLVSNKRYKFSADTSLFQPANMISISNTKYPGTTKVKGKFKLAFRNITSDWFDINTSIDNLQFYLNQEVESFGNNLIIYGSGNGYPFNVLLALPWFMFDGEHFDNISVADTNFTGGNIEGSSDAPSISFNIDPVYLPSDGAFWPVIPSDFLRTAKSSSQLRVWVNDTLSMCRGDCSYEYLSYPLFAKITSFAQTLSTLTITGANFPTDPSLLSVSLGYVDCIDISSTVSQITCTVQQGVYGSYQPIVKIEGQGIIPIDPSFTDLIDFSLSVDSVSPDSGSIMGGTTITISGAGFYDSLDNPNYQQVVNVEGSPCEVISTSTTQIECITSEETGSGTDLEVFVNGHQATLAYSIYSASSTPKVTSVTPDYASTTFQSEITITGTLFSDNPDDISVKIGKQMCFVKSSSTTEIKCSVLGGPGGVFEMKIFVKQYGYAQFQEPLSPDYEFKFDILTISPSIGSINGGTEITINGHGFSDRPSTLLVFIGDEYHPCTITSVVNAETIICTASAYTSDLTKDHNYRVFVVGRVQIETTCKGSCTFAWSDTATPVISSISSNTGVSGDTITIIGSNFGSILENIHFSFGDVEASIISCEDTQIVVTVPSTKNVYPTLALLIDGKGLGTLSGISFKNNVVVTNVSPKIISQGGEDVIITGSGFDKGMKFSFGSASCVVTKITNTQVFCKAAAFNSSNSPQSLVITGSGSFSCSDNSACAITFSSSYTPILGSSTTGFLTIPFTVPIGNGVVDDTTVQVWLNSTLCPLKSISSSEIICIPNVPAGSYKILLHVDGYGYSTGTLNTKISLSVTNVAANPSSYEGGQNVTLTGTGLSENLGVYLCGFQCKVEAATGESLTCLTPRLMTSYSQGTFKLADSQSKLTNFIVIYSAISGGEVAFDGNPDTYYRDTKNTFAYVGVDAGEGRYIQLSQVTLIGGGKDNYYYKNLIGTAIQGSQDNVNWDNLYNYTIVTDYTNTWNVPQNTQPSDNYPVYTYRYYRLYKEFAGNSYYINEVSIFGFIGLTETSQDITCDLTTTYLAASGRLLQSSIISWPSAVQYKSSITPYITDFTPKFGTSLGGDTIYFYGSNFGEFTTVSQVEVLIDEVACEVTYVTNTRIQCTTAPRPNYVPSSLSITISDVGFVITHGMTYLYQERWSDHATWGGEVPPFEGETVWIPQGQNILLDVATPHLGLILVEGSLIIEDIAGLSIDADYIFVHGGLLQIGTEKEPFENQFTITIHGDRNSATLPYYGSQFIAVRTGILDIHGKPRTPTWTVINSTISPGDLTFKVAETVDWKSGEEIVIASTSFDHNQAEMMTIAAVNGYEITVTSPFKYKHYGEIETYGTDTMDMRAEVGLLSRNIKIQGGPEGVPQECGVHVMLFAPGDESCIGRIEYAEFYHAGQAYRLGRYPIHFHMIGKVSLSYIRGNSIHHTFNRAITTHGVHYQTLENNVAYRNKGHAYFIEDGIETMNKFHHNLGIGTIASFSLLNTDQMPATFWITNPNNFFWENHAAGSDNFGYWVSPPENPGGPSSTTLVCPPFLPLGEFKDNTAHSNGQYGFRIWLGHVPLADPCSPGRDLSLLDPFSINTAVTANYYRYTGWKNQQDGAIAEDVGDVRFIDFKVADHHKNGIEISYSEFSEPYKTARISGALIIGKSNNTENNVAGAIGLTTPQTDGLLVENIKFHNFDDRMFPLGDESHSENGQVRDWGGRMHMLSGLSFNNSHKRISWNIPHRGIFKILDDSYNGLKNSYVTAYWPHLITPECVHEPDLYNAIVCQPNVTVKRVLFYSQNPFGIFAFQNLNIQRTSGIQIPLETYEIDINGTTVNQTRPTWASLPMTKACQKKNPLKAWGIPVVTGYNYTLFWGRGYPLDWMDMDIRAEQFDNDDQWVILDMNFTDHREMFNVTRGTLPLSIDKTDPNFSDPTKMKSVKQFSTSTDTSGTFHWDNSTDVRRFQIMFNGNNDHLYQYGHFHLHAYRCFGDHCSDLDVTDNELHNLTLVYWSDPSIWPDNKLPVKGQNVYVPNTWHLMLDTETPVLQYVEINGILEFDRTHNATLHSNWIFVRGGKLLSGSEEYPIPPNIFHTITLHGYPNSPQFAFMNDIEGGNKVLAVTGTVEMHGYPKTPWTLLSQNAYPGDTAIFVDNVDWTVGDEIVIAPSGFDYHESETFIITNIIGELPQYEIPPMNSSRILLDFSTDKDWIKANSLRNAGKTPQNTDQSLSEESVSGSSTGITKIILDKPLQFYHSGVQMLIQGQFVDTRTEVGVLNRNVKIQGDGYVGWGCTSVVSDFYDVLTSNNIPVWRYGSVNLTNVEFNQCAQEDTFKSALRFGLGGTVSSRVHNSVFRESYSFAVSMIQTSNVEFSNNLIYRTLWKGIVGSEITNVSYTDNLVIGTMNRGFLTNDLDVPACFFICADPPNCVNITTLRNRGVGCGLTSFILGGQDCNTNKVSHYVADNIAHSSSIGYIISGQQGASCVSATNLKAYFCGQGIGSQGGAVNSYKLSGLVMVENQLGLAIRGTYNDDFDHHTSYISNSLFVGRTQNSYCDGSNCTLADCMDRKGYITGVFDVKVKHLKYADMISPPIYGAMRMECGYGHWELSQNTFINFKPYKCGRDFAIAGNDMVPNLSWPSLVSKTSFINVDDMSIAWMPKPDVSLIGVGFCGNWVCTGENNILIQDIDGTITGSDIGGAIIPYVPGIANLNICKPNSDGKSFICPYDKNAGEFYEFVIFESMDADKWNRTFSPLNITSFDIGNGKAFQSYNFEGFRNDLNEYEDMTWIGFYRDSSHLSRFGSIIYTGQYYNLTMTGTPPGKLTVVTEANLDSSKGFVMALRYDSPQIINVYVNGTKIKALQYDGVSTPVCQLSDPTGTNRWFHENATIQWVQRGNVNITLIQTSSVQLTMELDMTLKEFYSDTTRATFIDRLASVLNIPSYRIRIASVKQGSVILNMMIEPDENLEGKISTTGASLADEELKSINTKINELANNAAYLSQSLGVTVLAVTSKTSIVSSSQTDTRSNGSSGGNANNGGSNGGNNGGNNGGGGDNYNPGGNIIFEGHFNEAVSDWVIGLLIGLILVIMATGSVLAFTFSRRKRFSFEEPVSAKVRPILTEIDEHNDTSFESPKKSAFEFEEGDSHNFHRVFITNDEESKEVEADAIKEAEEIESVHHSHHASLMDA